MIDNSTICAIATASGHGAVAIIRVSGKEAFEIGDKIFIPKNAKKTLSNEKANTVHFGTLTDNGRVIDEVLVSVFRAPRSYTGEDTLEISCHGSPVIQQEIMQVLIKNGARAAGPGEFTLRSFLNGKMDLSQAEAVADLIKADSEMSRRVAVNQMRGGFSLEIGALRAKLLEFVSLIELELDFSEEDVEFADRSKLRDLILRINEVVKHLSDSFRAGNIIKSGVPVAIVGAPNVGKSTLLNVLLNDEKAIVSEIAGTTRDVIEDTFTIDGILFRFIDTAGLRHTEDVVENMGIERTLNKIKQAAVVLMLFTVADADEHINERIAEMKQQASIDTRWIAVLNKADTGTEISAKRNISVPYVQISAKHKSNIRDLIEILQDTVNLKNLNTDETIVTNLRHYEALQNTQEALQRALTGMDTMLPADLFAQDVREALHHLGLITGEITTDEVLGNIFSKFCIGK